MSLLWDHQLHRSKAKDKAGAHILDGVIGCYWIVGIRVVSVFLGVAW
jgi:hypothetical protein